jgi:hypothetical protein
MGDITFAIVLVLIGLVLLYSATVCKLSCGGKESYGAFNDYCRWDSRRFCTLPDGAAGKCVMNGLCVPPMLKVDGPSLPALKAAGVLSPATRSHSPVAKTWRWKEGSDPSLDTLDTLDAIEARDLRNDYSDASVMDYVDLKADAAEPL